MDFVSQASDKPITEAAYLAAAEDLDCDVAAVKAVADVETKDKPFQGDGRPTILYERHWFRRFTNGRFNASHPVLSGPPGNYGKSSEQWGKLEEAISLDREAALKSASYGQFQIMGFNYRVVGFDNVEEFVAAMADTAERHLEAFVGFVLANRLDAPLRKLDWKKFARGYNGSQYRKNNYDTKMAAAYEKFASEPATVQAPSTVAPTAFSIRSVQDLQKALKYLGMDPGPIDNKMGPKTGNAIRAFERFMNANETGKFSVETRAAIQAAYHLMRKFDALVAA